MMNDKTPSKEEIDAFVRGRYGSAAKIDTIDTTHILIRTEAGDYRKARLRDVAKVARHTELGLSRQNEYDELTQIVREQMADEREAKALEAHNSPSNVAARAKAQRENEIAAERKSQKDASLNRRVDVAIAQSERSRL